MWKFVDVDPKAGACNELIIALEIEEETGKLGCADRTGEICNDRVTALDHTAVEGVWKFDEAVRTAGFRVGRRIARDSILGRCPARGYSFNKEDINVAILVNGIEV